MKIAVIGSRSISSIHLKNYISQDAKDEIEIVSGGAVGVDHCAAEYAKANGFKLTEFLPNYPLYGRAAPIIRNKQIVDYADKIFIFWNGKSRGTLSVIKYAKQINKPHQIIICL